MIPGLKLIDDILKGLPENARLRSELGDLRAAFLKLQTEKEQSDAKLKDAHIEIERLRQSHQPPDQLPTESEQLLLIIANGDGRLTSDMAIERVGIPQARGDYFFDFLTAREFVESGSGRIGVGWFYHATSRGRAYLAGRGLL